MSEQSYQLELGVFEGPLDLLLHLLDKNELNIYDVPLTLVAEQYVAYLESLDSLDMEVASEFLIVAAQLMYIKSKALLPRSSAVEEESEEDLEERLRLQLLEYRAFKDISAYLRELFTSQAHFARRPSFAITRKIDMELQSPLELLNSLKRLHTEEISLFESEELIPLEPFNIEERMSEIEEILASSRTHTMRLDQLLAKGNGRMRWLSCILAILELVRRQRVNVRQESAFAMIYLTAKE